MVQRMQLDNNKRRALQEVGRYERMKRKMKEDERMRNEIEKLEQERDYPISLFDNKRFFQKCP